MIVTRLSTEGLFHTHGRSEVVDDREARETLLITRATSEKLFDSAFRLPALWRARAVSRRRLAHDKVWIARGVDIARHWRAVHPDP